MLSMCLCLTLLLCSQPTKAQWSQSLGWGSAGNGKRALVESSARVSEPDLCSYTSNLQKLINVLQRVIMFYLTIYLSICLSVCRSVCLPICLSIYLFIDPPVHPKENGYTLRRPNCQIVLPSLSKGFFSTIALFSLLECTLFQ